MTGRARYIYHSRADLIYPCVVCTLGHIYTILMIPNTLSTVLEGTLISIMVLERPVLSLCGSLSADNADNCRFDDYTL